MKKAFNKILSFLPYILVFIGSLYSSSDPDLGWHLKYGEYFFKTGRLLRDNPFSTLMPDYKWANVSWGTDIITYLTFNIGGFLALTILGALVVSLTFYFFAKAAKLTIWDQVFLFPLLLFLQIPINSVSFRGQQISLMLLGVLFYILSIYKKGSRAIFLLIPLFLMWANLHGEFILGLVMLFGWIIMYALKFAVEGFLEYKTVTSVKNSILKHKNELSILTLVLLLSSLVTLINPFGIALHLDAISHIGSPLLKNIGEYLPLPSLSQAWWNQVIIAILLFVGVLFMIFRGKFFSKAPVLASALLLYILSFSVRRFAWPAYYLVLPILQPISGFIKPDSKKITNITSFILLVIITIIIVLEKKPFTQFAKFNWDEYCMSEFILCSPKSVEFIKKNNLTTNLYSVYGWGGYIIWNFPEIKPTIDGRMHMWKDEKDYSGFVEYYSYEQNQKDINDSKYNVALMSPEKPVYNRLLELTNERKWKIVYQDKVSGVFVRN